MSKVTNTFPCQRKLYLTSNCIFDIQLLIMLSIIIYHTIYLTIYLMFLPSWWKFLPLVTTFYRGTQFKIILRLNKNSCNTIVFYLHFKTGLYYVIWIWDTKQHFKNRTLLSNLDLGHKTQILAID